MGVNNFVVYCVVYLLLMFCKLLVIKFVLGLIKKFIKVVIFFGCFKWFKGCSVVFLVIILVLLVLFCW